MPRGSATINVDASTEATFDLIHDYARRLDWDSMLSEARLLGGAEQAGLGVRSLCVGTWRSAYMPMETEYVSFHRGVVAAVTLTNRPWLFERFAATIRHTALGPDRSRVTYIYSFQTRPALLRRILDPMIGWMMGREVRARLRALQHALRR